jgi:hypothetical protein
VLPGLHGPVRYRFQLRKSQRSLPWRRVRISEQPSDPALLADPTRRQSDGKQRIATNHYGEISNLFGYLKALGVNHSRQYRTSFSQ